MEKDGDKKEKKKESLIRGPSPRWSSVLPEGGGGEAAAVFSGSVSYAEGKKPE